MGVPRLARHGLRLQQTIRLAEPALAARTGVFWKHRQLTELFPEFLFLVHCSVRATIPLMQAADRRASELADSDPVAAKLADYYPQHIREEQDHEEWLLRDMESIGIARAETLARVPPPSVAAMAGSQYYWIHHAHPVTLLGFFAVLEGLPPRVEHLERVRLQTGLPRTAFRMLLAHAELDPQHGDEVFALVDDLPLTDAQAELVGLSALHTIESLVVIFEELTTAAAGVTVT